MVPKCYTWSLVLCVSLNPHDNPLDRYYYFTLQHRKAKRLAKAKYGGLCL